MAIGYPLFLVFVVVLSGRGKAKTTEMGLLIINSICFMIFDTCARLPDPDFLNLRRRTECQPSPKSAERIRCVLTLTRKRRRLLERKTVYRARGPLLI